MTQTIGRLASHATEPVVFHRFQKSAVRQECRDLREPQVVLDSVGYLGARAGAGGQIPI